MGHEHCGGAGMPCQNPECRFSVTRTGLVCPKCRRSHGEIEMETHRVIRFRCKSCRYEWYAEHGNVERDGKTH
jgi:transposase-like protein